MQKIEEPIGEPTVVTVGKDITPGLQSLDSNSKLSVTKFLNHKNSKQKKQTYPNACIGTFVKSSEHHPSAKWRPRYISGGHFKISSRHLQNFYSHW